MIRSSVCRASLGRYSTATRREPFKILFCGSDGFSIASLQAILDAPELWQSIHVLTPSETKVGRGGRKVHRPSQLYIPELMKFAEEKRLERSTVPFLVDLMSRKGVFRKKPLDERGRVARLDDLWVHPEGFKTPDHSHLLITASFGHILPNNLLHRFDPTHRLNVHPSLLPRWRGAAPIQWTIASGDETTGVSVQRLVEKGKGVDAGEILGSAGGIAVPDGATYGSLMPVLAEAGGRLLVDVLRDTMTGTINAIPQDPSLKTLAPKIGKETGHIRWLEQNAVELDRLSRAIGHQGPLWSELHGARFQFLDFRQVPTPSVPTGLRTADHRPGTAWLDKSPSSSPSPSSSSSSSSTASSSASDEPSPSRRILIACVPESVTPNNPWVRMGEMGHSWAEVRTIRKEGRKEMGVGEWWNGLPSMERNRNWVQFKGRRFLEKDEEGE